MHERERALTVKDLRERLVRYEDDTVVLFDADNGYQKVLKAEGVKFRSGVTGGETPFVVLSGEYW